MPRARAKSAASQILLETIESNEIDTDLAIAFCRLIRERSFRMPLTLIAELIPCSLRTLERYVQEEPIMKYSGVMAAGQRGGAKLYPYWLIHHFFHLRERKR